MGERHYVAFADEVVEVAIVDDGDGGRNLKRTPPNPVVVRNMAGDEWVMGRAELFADPLAASIRSAELLAQVDTD